MSHFTNTDTCECAKCHRKTSICDCVAFVSDTNFKIHDDKLYKAIALNELFVGYEYFDQYFHYYDLESNPRDIKSDEDRENWRLDGLWKYLHRDDDGIATTEFLPENVKTIIEKVINDYAKMVVDNCKPNYFVYWKLLERPVIRDVYPIMNYYTLKRSTEHCHWKYVFSEEIDNSIDNTLKDVHERDNPLEIINHTLQISFDYARKYSECIPKAINCNVGFLRSRFHFVCYSCLGLPQKDC